MQKLNVMAPRNMGQTIRFGWLEEDLWDVKFDESQFSVNSGAGITLKSTVLKPLKDLDIVAGAINSTNLELERVDGTKLQIELASLIPQSKQDVYLKEVSYNNQTKEIQFLVGTKSKTLHTYTVGVNALIPIIAGNGLEGDGTSEHPLKVKLPENSKLQSDTSGVDFAGTIYLVDAFYDVHFGWFFPGSTNSTAVENGGGVDRPVVKWTTYFLDKNGKPLLPERVSDKPLESRRIPGYIVSSLTPKLNEETHEAMYVYIKIGDFAPPTPTPGTPVKPWPNDPTDPMKPADPEYIPSSSVSAVPGYFG